MKYCGLVIDEWVYENDDPEYLLEIGIIAMIKHLGALKAFNLLVKRRFNQVYGIGE